MRDIDIRRALRLEIRRMHLLEPDTLFVEELGLCQGIARVDLVVVNGTLHGYEIKSEHDTLNRLPAQAGIYSRALEYMTVVAAPLHAEKVGTVVPGWWGIWSAITSDEGIQLTMVRRPQRNPNIDPFSLAQLLWRDEALEELNKRGRAFGMKSKPREKLWHRLASELTVAELASVIRERLKRRGASWRALGPQA